MGPWDWKSVTPRAAQEASLIPRPVPLASGCAVFSSLRCDSVTPAPLLSQKSSVHDPVGDSFVEWSDGQTATAGTLLLHAVESPSPWLVE